MNHEKDALPSLNELQRKIDEAKPAGKEDRDSDSASDMSMAMRAGIDLVAGVAAGALIGYALDRWFGTMPLFFIICFFLGAAGGFRNMLRSVQRKAGE